MDQFRHIGEVLGSLKALILLQDDTQINRRQCILLFDIFTLAFNIIGEEIKQNLRLDERNIKWKALDHPLRELHRIFKEGEFYVKHCMDNKDWWGKAISFHQNKDCVELHLHSLLCCFPAVIEAIETAGEIAGLDQVEMQKRRVVLAKKYAEEWNDPKLFQWRFGKQYLVSREICNRLESAWREDRWLLVEALKEKKVLEAGTMMKNEKRLGDLLIKKLSGLETFNGKFFPASILVGAKDYHVRRRLGGGNQYKEIHWLGENFALRYFHGEIAPLSSEISSLLSLSHPNILQYLCGFYDVEMKECFLVMELMNKDLSSHIRETCSPRRRILFSLPVVVDLMLQIARGMEYLHSQKIYHGDLNPSNVLLKARSSTEGYFFAKITGFGLSSVKNHSSQTSPEKNGTDVFIWHAPEVLLDQEKVGSKCTSKYEEKADVYSFGMLCFELLTGKIPFEDGHLQGDKMSKNIRAGERPLFPFSSPKYIVNLTKRCWQTDPSLRPSFSSICRVLRYIKKFLVMNPDHGQPELQLPPVDYLEIESWFVKNLPSMESFDQTSVSQIPFQMFSYRLAEKERSSLSLKDKNWETGSFSIFRDEKFSGEDPFLPSADVRSVRSEALHKKFIPANDTRSVCSEAPDSKILSMKRVTIREAEQNPANDTRLNSSESRDTVNNRMPVCSEIPEKKVSSVKKVADSKATKSPDTDAQSKKNLSTSHSKAVRTEFNARSVRSEASEKRIASPKTDMKIRKGPGTPKAQIAKSQSQLRCSRSLDMSRDTQLHLVTIPRRRTATNQPSESEI